MNKLTPPQIVVLSFVTVILVGTFLLCLPISTTKKGSMNFIDALFTSVSATCVTGLIVKNTGTFFTPFGQGIILFLFQIGGLGIMTFSVLLGVLLGKRLSVSENTVIKSTISGDSSSILKSVPALLKNIVKLVFSIEIVGALLLFLRWTFAYETSWVHNLYSAIFHAVSAFCNAGFCLYKDSFIRYQSDVYINLIMMSLIVVGGLGFVVLLSLPALKFWKKQRKNIWAKINVQTKIVLVVSLFLIFLGAITLFLLEYNGFMKDFSFKNKLLASFFQSVTARTAGFNTITIGKLAQPSLLFLIIIMFIGASPGSTGSGIKTTTFAILIAAAVSMFKNRDHVSIFSKTVPKEVVREAILVFLFSLFWLIGMTFLVLFFQSLSTHNYNFIRVFFEVTSALGNVGLSTGITFNLTSINKILLSLTMLVGRIGPLTLAWAVILHKGKVSYKYPEERIMVG